MADVRRFPSSRHHPQFNGESLTESLAAVGIDYLHFPELGGRREPRPGSVNTGWRQAGFRGYADYMQTAEFRAGTVRLLGAASSRRCAIMCAEKAWQNCHRGLISDVLKASGLEVFHIVDREHDEQHPYTKPARLIDGILSYAATTPTQSRLDL
ncbi:MAG: DUF488 domain-containing protein [Betaproteobacteria bacterium]|nr:DUF488 domain-containing protein [Betaproteobacteria bacterium]